MNWLARLDVEAETAFGRRIFDNYAWHKRIWEDCFERAPDAKRDFLTRIDQLEKSFRIWILAKRKPMRPAWCSSTDFAIKGISPSFLSHRYYAFDLRANPTKCINQQAPDGSIVHRKQGTHTKGKRVAIVKPEELRAWFLRKAQIRAHDLRTGGDIPSGFRILEDRPLEISPMVGNHFRRNGDEAYHGGVEFRGVLEVTDRERFAATYEAGIGSAKGFGFGLFLLAPTFVNNQNSNL